VTHQPALAGSCQLLAMRLQRVHVYWVVGSPVQFAEHCASVGCWRDPMSVSCLLCGGSFCVVHIWWATGMPCRRCIVHIVLSAKACKHLTMCRMTRICQLQLGTSCSPWVAHKQASLLAPALLLCILACDRFAGCMWLSSHIDTTIRV
jgi:hypothetical protein